MAFRFDEDRGSGFRPNAARNQANSNGLLKSLPSFGDILRLLPDPPKTNSLKYYVVGFAICTVLFAMPLVRIRFTGNHNSSIASAFYWLPSNIANCIIIMYPWYTVVGRECPPFLRSFYAVAITFTVVLAALGFVAELFVPNDPLHNFEPDKISDTYRIVTTIRWTWAFIFGYIVGPMFLIRSHEQFESKKRGLLYFVVFPCILYAYFALLMRDLTGTSVYMTMGGWVVLIWILLLLFDRNADCETEPTYIILTSFIITSLTFTAGTIMLGWFQVATPFGKLFVLVVWEVMVFLVRHIVARSAARATNTDQSSAFVFNVVLAGEMYSEFVFLTVDFNTPIFWGLVILSMSSVIISEGGLLDDLDLWLKVAFVPWLKRTILCSTEEPEAIPLEVKAHTLRHQWRINDLTMIAEFVALCSGVCCVLFEYIYHQSDVGADSLTYNYPRGERLDQLKVFGVLAVGVLCAQLVARLMIRRKVTMFKAEVLQAHGRAPAEEYSRFSEMMEPIVERLSEVMEQVNPLRRNSRLNRARRAESIDASNANSAGVEHLHIPASINEVEAIGHGVHNSGASDASDAVAQQQSTIDVDTLPTQESTPPLRKTVTVDNADLQQSRNLRLPENRRRSSGGIHRRNSSDPNSRPGSGRFNMFETVDLESSIQRTLDEVHELMAQPFPDKTGKGDVELATVDTSTHDTKAKAEPECEDLHVCTNGANACDHPNSPPALSRQSIEGGKFMDSLRRHETHDLDLRFWRTHFHYFIATVAFTVVNVIYRVVQLNYEL